jgi:hypothetical protein
MTSGERRLGPAWTVALLICVGISAVAAALNMMRMHVPFLTTHAADIFCPAFLYIQLRKFWQQESPALMGRFFGRTPELAAAVLFLGSAATEISQKYYPHGFFPGTYDPWDIGAYALGIGGCYLLEKIGVGMLTENRPSPSR